MKLKIPGKGFYRIVALAASAVKPSPSMPIVENVRLVAGEERLFAFGTDLTVGIFASSLATVGTTGSVSVDAKTLLGIARALGPFDVEISLKGSKLVIKTTGSKFSLNATDGESYPTIPGLRNPRNTHVDSALLGTALDRVAYAASRESNARFALDNVFIDPCGETLRLVAADRPRIAYCELQVDEALEPSLIPIVTIPSIQNILNAVKGEVSLGTANGILSVGSEDTVITVRLCDETYPQYEKLIPAVAPWAILFERDAFVDAINCAMLVTDDKHGDLKISFDEKEMTLSARSEKFGESSESFPVEYLEGGIPDFEIAFAGDWLVDAMRTLETEKVEMRLCGEKRPIIFKSPDRTDALAFVAPLHG